MNKTQQDLISVIIPTHNRASTIVRALESVFAQSYTNLEVIVIADNCTDNTEEVLKPYIEEKKIRYIPLEKNVGGAEARNIGLDNASGEYIAFLDDDDEWLPEKTTMQLAILHENTDVAVVTCDYLYIDTKGNALPKTRQQWISPEDMGYKNYCGSFSFCMTKKEYILDLRISPNLKSAQDWDLWFKVMHKSRKKGYNINKPLVKYYGTDTNRISKSHEQNYKSRIKFLRNIWQLLDEKQKAFNTSSLIVSKSFFLNPGFLNRTRFAKKAVALYDKANHKKNMREKLEIINIVMKLISFRY